MVKNYSKLIAIVATILLLQACEIIVPKDFEVDEQEVLALYQNVPLKDVMNKVQKKFTKAKNDEIYFYSPNNYRTARTGIQIARSHFRDPEKKIHVLKSLHRADKALDEGQKVKIIAVRELKDHVVLRDILDSLEARKSHTREYRSLITSLVSIIEVIESKQEEIFKDPGSKADFDERKADMMVRLQDFRMRVVKHRYLNHGEQLIAEADTYDAKNIAPVTYAETLAERDKAVAFVTGNVDNLEAVGDVAKKFQYVARRLLHITRAVSLVINLEKNTHEQYVLKQEERLIKIANALKWPNSLNNSFAAQASQIASKVKRLVSEKEKSALTIAELQSGGVVKDDAGEAQANTSTDTAEDPAPVPKPKGIEIIGNASGGDPEELKRSVRLLTDQVYQLTLEKNEWDSQRAKLNAEIKKLQAANKPKAKPKAKTKPKTKPKSKAKQPAPKKDTKKEVKKEVKKDVNKAPAKETTKEPAKKKVDDTKKPATPKSEPEKDSADKKEEAKPETKTDTDTQPESKPEDQAKQ